MGGIMRMVEKRFTQTLDVKTLTLYHSLAVRSIITNLLDVAKVDVTEEDTVSSLSPTSSVIESESYDILHMLWVFKWFYGCIQVVFV